VNLAVLGSFDDARVLERDQVLLLHRARLVKDLVRRVDAVEAEDDQGAHVVVPCGGVKWRGSLEYVPSGRFGHR
jgi:hypothetical protein